MASGAYFSRRMMHSSERIGNFFHPSPRSKHRGCESTLKTSAQQREKNTVCFSLHYLGIVQQQPLFHCFQCCAQVQVDLPKTCFVCVCLAKFNLQTCKLSLFEIRFFLFFFLYKIGEIFLVKRGSWRLRLFPKPKNSRKFSKNWKILLQISEKIVQNC